MLSCDQPLDWDELVRAVRKTDRIRLFFYRDPRLRIEESLIRDLRLDHVWKLKPKERIH